LKIGKSFNTVDIVLLVSLIKICVNRINLEMTDVDIPKMMIKGKRYSQKSAYDGDKSVDDFIHIVIAGGCHQLVEELLKNKVVYGHLYRDRRE
jgi:hypothetical protein